MNGKDRRWSLRKKCLGEMGKWNAFLFFFADRIDIEIEDRWTDVTLYAHWWYRFISFAGKWWCMKILTWAWSVYHACTNETFLQCVFIKLSQFSTINGALELYGALCSYVWSTHTKTVARTDYFSCIIHDRFLCDERWTRIQFSTFHSIRQTCSVPRTAHEAVSTL